MISSTVSSKILRAIAQKEGFNFEETLTGFKWIANKAYEIMQKGGEVIFSFEEWLARFHWEFSICRWKLVVGSQAMHIFDWIEEQKTIKLKGAAFENGCQYHRKAQFYGYG